MGEHELVDHWTWSDPDLWFFPRWLCRCGYGRTQPLLADQRLIRQLIRAHVASHA